MTWKIIVDSEVITLATPAIDTIFVSVPLTIQVAGSGFLSDIILTLTK